MLAYNNDPQLRKSVIAEMASHREADELLQGYGYWKDGKGCAVGCLIKGSDHSLYETKFGIPQMLARLEDDIFEGLSKSDAQKWPERFLSTIEPGQDLSLVGWKFLHWLQTENLKNAKKHKMPTYVISAIKQCADVLVPLTKGEPVNTSAAESARLAAESAPMSAWSVAYEKMADQLIVLIKAAPKAKGSKS